MGNIKLTEKGKEKLIEQIEQYYVKFGSMNKNDFEVLLLYVLMKNGDKELSNFELSRILRIPESKVKRLRYEADLKYSPESDSAYNDEKFEQLNKILKNVTFKKDGKLIEFVVEDVALRQFLDNILKSNNRFSDSSFNSEIVKIDIDDLGVILCSSVKDKALYNTLLDNAEKILNERVSFSKLVPQLIQLGANATTIAANVSTGITNVSLTGLLTLLPTVSGALIEIFKK